MSPLQSLLDEGWFFVLLELTVDYAIATVARRERGCVYVLIFRNHGDKIPS
jgi:hypothetical protein